MLLSFLQKAGLVRLSFFEGEWKGMFEKINEWIKWLDGAIWGLPLIIFILAAGIFMTIRLGGLQIRKLPKALEVHGQKRGRRPRLALCAPRFPRPSAPAILSAWLPPW